MNLTREQRAWYLKWLCETPQGASSQEQERRRFLREFHVPTAFELLSEVEAWPADAAEPEPGELVMQRWFRLSYMKMQVHGEARTCC